MVVLGKRLLCLAQSSRGGFPWTSPEYLAALEKEDRDMDAELHIASVVPQGLWGAFLRFFGWAYEEQGGNEIDSG